MEKSLSSLRSFIVLSKAFGKILNQEYQVDHSKIRYSRWGRYFRFQTNLSRSREQLGWPQDRMILFTPPLVHRMGLDKLLSALAKIKPLIPDVWLAIAGRGPLQASLSAG